MSLDIEELFLEGARILTLKQFAEALKIFNKVLEIDPNHIKALEARAVIYIQKGEIELAKIDLERAIGIEPKNARLYFRLGQVYYSKKDLDTALELIDKAIEIEPLYPAAYMVRSQILREKGLEEAADLELDKAVAVQRELAKARKVVDF